MSTDVEALRQALTKSYEREAEYLRAIVEDRDDDIYDLTMRLGVLTGLVLEWRAELVARGEHTLVATIDTALNR